MEASNVSHFPPQQTELPAWRRAARIKRKKSRKQTALCQHAARQTTDLVTLTFIHTDRVSDTSKY